MRGLAPKQPLHRHSLFTKRYDFAACFRAAVLTDEGASADPTSLTSHQASGEDWEASAAELEPAVA